MATKYIVSNKGALGQKYLGQVSLIEAAFDPIIAADRAAGITTTLLYLDDTVEMQKIGAPPVTDPGDAAQNKHAIDGIFHAKQPDYLTIFGAPDVVAHQPLHNPTGDSDPDVPSDLPYACSAGFSTQIKRFLSPSRVITRVPDLTGSPAHGAKDVTYPLRVLANAANRSRGSRKDYEGYFGLSVADWSGSTTTSLRHIFGNSTELYLSPPDGPDWLPQQMQALSFFVNVHGSDTRSKFVGQCGKDYPVCMASAKVKGSLSTNMVFSVEACYGAQLYDPSLAPDKEMGIVNQAVLSGCCGYFGSSNIAYGPKSGQGAADIITQEFLKSILAGKTVGQATLDARALFIHGQDMASPTNLKTIAQFMLMGNAGFAPVDPAAALERMIGATGGYMAIENERRALELSRAVDHSEPAPDHRVPAFVTEAIERIAREREFTSYTVSPHRVVFNESHAYLYADRDVHVYHVVETFEREGLDPGHHVVEITASRDEILKVAEFVSK